jgi:hypothetical protein
MAPRASLRAAAATSDNGRYVRHAADFDESTISDDLTLALGPTTDFMFAQVMM